MNMITLCNAQLSLAAADKIMILVSTNTTKHVFCRDKTRFLSRQNVCRDEHVFVVFVAIKIILAAAPVNDTQPLTPILNCDEQNKKTKKSLQGQGYSHREGSDHQKMRSKHKRF